MSKTNSLKWVHLNYNTNVNIFFHKNLLAFFCCHHFDNDKVINCFNYRTHTTSIPAKVNTLLHIERRLDDCIYLTSIVMLPLNNVISQVCPLKPSADINDCGTKIAMHIFSHLANYFIVWVYKFNSWIHLT